MGKASVRQITAATRAARAKATAKRPTTAAARTLVIAAITAGRGDVRIVVSRSVAERAARRR